MGRPNADDLDASTFFKKTNDPEADDAYRQRVMIHESDRAENNAIHNGFTNMTGSSYQFPDGREVSANGRENVSTLAAAMGPYWVLDHVADAATFALGF